MDNSETIKLVRRLKQQFDDESVELALSELSSKNFDWRLVSPLRQGRGSAQRDSLINEAIATWGVSRDNASFDVPHSTNLAQNKEGLYPFVAEKAASHFPRKNWTEDATLLLIALMNAKGRAQDPKWIKSWYLNADESSLDGKVVATHLRTTGGCRKSIGFARVALAIPVSDYMEVARALLPFYRRKFFRRGFDRELKRNVRGRTVHHILPDLLKRAPSKRNRALAKQALKLALPEDAHRILLELLRHTDDPEVVRLAKQRVAQFPNAPDSFDLMRGLASIDPDLAVPWLFTWIETARFDQACEAMITILVNAPTPENFQAARVWFEERKELAIGAVRGSAFDLATLLKRSL
ncbi:hypothetical protein KF728_26950 [Candidatus Obscuribacterales bacterium]|nr:hypothetical protein [Candidatus Obscuribacterales bacterium]MBX3153821.1 hypothetical protein [Candidatus Obscuribacterales bacterium]